MGKTGLGSICVRSLYCSPPPFVESGPIAAGKTKEQDLPINPKSVGLIRESTLHLNPVSVGLIRESTLHLDLDLKSWVSFKEI